MDYLSQISHFEAGEDLQGLFALSVSDIHPFLKIEAGKAAVRLLAKTGEDAISHPSLVSQGVRMFPVLAVLHVARDSQLCWSGKLEPEVREYAGTVAVEMLARSANLKLLLDKVISDPEIPALCKSKALRALDPIMAERKAKAAGVFHGHIGYEVDTLPATFGALVRRGQESGFDTAWKVDAGLWLVQANYDEYDWQYGISSGTLDLEDLSHAYTTVPLKLNNFEVPEIVRIYAGMRAIDIACKGTNFDHLADEAGREGTLGSLADELTDPETVPPTVARAAITRLEQKLEKVREEIREKLIGTVVEVKPPKKAPEEPKTPAGRKEKI